MNNFKTILILTSLIIATTPHQATANPKLGMKLLEGSAEAWKRTRPLRGTISENWNKTRTARENGKKLWNDSEPAREVVKAVHQCHGGYNNPTTRNERRQPTRQLCENVSPNRN